MIMMFSSIRKIGSQSVHQFSNINKYNNINTTIRKVSGEPRFPTIYESIEYGMILPVKVGGFVGTIWGAYNGFIDGRSETLLTNVASTSVGMIGGCMIGGVVGLVWPVTMFVAVGRMLPK